MQPTQPSLRPTGPKTKLDKLNEKLAPKSVMAMTKADFSKTYAKLGRARFDEANDLMRWAALAAAESEKCPKVEIMGLSDAATRSALKWWVDCSNGERFNISEPQVRATRARLDPTAKSGANSAVAAADIAEPKSARWAKFNEGNVVSVCDMLVQKTMLVPNTFKTAWRWEIDKNDDTGIVIIERDFKSENAYGMKLNMRYRCTVDANQNDLKGLSIREPDGWRSLM